MVLELLRRSLSPDPRLFMVANGTDYREASNRITPGQCQHLENGGLAVWLLTTTSGSGARACGAPRNVSTGGNSNAGSRRRPGRRG